MGTGGAVGIAGGGVGDVVVGGYWSAVVSDGSAPGTLCESAPSGEGEPYATRSGGGVFAIAAPPTASTRAAGPRFQRPRGTLTRTPLRHELGAEILHEPIAEPERARDQSGFSYVRLEVTEEGLRARVARVAIGREGAANDAKELVFMGKAARRKIRNFRPARLFEERRHSPLPFRAVQATAREQLPQDDARREHVGARVERVTARLLGAHVPGLAADHVVGHGRRHVVRAGDAEVAQLDLALEADEHVRRRDVAMHDAERLARRRSCADARSRDRVASR